MDPKSNDNTSLDSNQIKNELTRFIEYQLNVNKKLKQQLTECNNQIASLKEENENLKNNSNDTPQDQEKTNKILTKRINKCYEEITTLKSQNDKKEKQIIFLHDQITNLKKETENITPLVTDKDNNKNQNKYSKKQKPTSLIEKNEYKKLLKQNRVYINQWLNENIQITDDFNDVLYHSELSDLIREFLKNNNIDGVSLTAVGKQVGRAVSKLHKEYDGSKIEDYRKHNNDEYDYHGFKLLSKDEKENRKNINSLDNIVIEDKPVSLKTVVTTEDIPSNVELLNNKEEERIIEEWIKNNINISDDSDSYIKLSYIINNIISYSKEKGLNYRDDSVLRKTITAKLNDFYLANVGKKIEKGIESNTSELYYKNLVFK